MTMQQLMTFVRRIDALPEAQRNAVRLLFHNPTDAAVPAFECFAQWSGVEVLSEIIDAAETLGIEHADHVSMAFLRWMHEGSEDAGGEFDGTEDLNDARITKPYLFVE